MRDLARLIGRMTATSPAILQAPLRYRNLQRLKIQALHRTQFSEAIVVLDLDTKGELDWWITSMISQNGKSILTQEPDLTMEADASLLGWGQCAMVYAQAAFGHQWRGWLTSTVWS